MSAVIPVVLIHVCRWVLFFLDHHMVVVVMVVVEVVVVANEIPSSETECFFDFLGWWNRFQLSGKNLYTRKFAKPPKRKGSLAIIFQRRVVKFRRCKLGVAPNPIGIKGLVYLSTNPYLEDFGKTRGVYAYYVYILYFYAKICVPAPSKGCQLNPKWLSSLQCFLRIKLYAVPWSCRQCFFRDSPQC